MRRITVATENLSFPGQLIREYCAAPVCCIEAGSCEGLPAWPDYLFLTITDGLEECLLTLDDTTGDEDFAFYPAGVDTIDTGINQKCLFVNAWVNGSYRFKRVNTNEYILDDSYAPFRMGTRVLTELGSTSTISVGGLINPAGGFPFVTWNPATGVVGFSAGNGCDDTPLPFDDGSITPAEVYVSLAECQYSIGCDVDAVYCDCAAGLNLISCSPAAIAKWQAYSDSVAPPAIAPLNNSVGLVVCTADTSVLHEYPFAMTHRIYRQGWIRLGCQTHADREDIPDDPPGIVRAIAVIQLFSYVSTTINENNTKCGSDYSSVIRDQTTLYGYLNCDFTTSGTWIAPHGDATFDVLDPMQAPLQPWVFDNFGEGIPDCSTTLGGGIISLTE